MADLCRRLREAREQAGLSIGEISARTKISAATLRAIEAGEFDRLPGDFYARAFLKTYAGELHLPVDAVLRDYAASREPAQPFQVDAGAVSPRLAAEQGTQYVAGEAEDGLTGAGYRSMVARMPSGSGPWAGVIFAGLLVMAATLVIRQFPGTESGKPETAAVVPAAVSEAAPVPVATAGRQDAPLQKLSIEISPSAEVWVSAKADGKTAVYRLLKPGEHVVIDAQNELSFRIGNAEAFAYAINGVPGKPLGGAGAVRDFRINRDNYLTFRR